MPQARFLLLSTTTGRSADVTWRLVAGNNHDLGRSPSVYDDVEAARAAVEALRTALPTLVSAHAPDSRPGRWGWVLRSGTEVQAVSSRWYERQRESRYSLTQFLAALPTAPLSPTVAVRPRARELRRAELRTPSGGDAHAGPAPLVPAQARPVDVGSEAGR